MTTREAAAIYERLGQPVPGDSREAKASKYRNTKKEVDGVVFDSALEARAWRILKLWESAGQISRIRRQVPFRLTSSVGRPIVYKADFTFYDSEGKLRVLDAKGYLTPVFRIKAKFFAEKFPELKLELWTKTEIAAMERGK